MTPERPRAPTTSGWTIDVPRIAAPELPDVTPIAPPDFGAGAPPPVRDWLKGSLVSPLLAEGTGADVFSASDPYVTELPAILVAGRPVFPEPLRAAGLSGRLMVEAIVDTTGRAEPASIVVTRTAHAGFNRAAIAFVQGALFRPGRVNGKAVRVRVRIPVDFVLRR
jgi:TonB family protein